VTRRPSAQSTGMHPQLVLLMELQDLRSQHKELEEGGEGTIGTVEREHFHIDLDQAREELGRKIAELEDTLDSAIQERYRKILPHRDRVVVPVIAGVCYGCFVSIPTATVGDWEAHQSLRNCENCGRFIYILS
jgi:predicted  nucleic acid-binding Zn-ribbon protein